MVSETGHLDKDGEDDARGDERIALLMTAANRKIFFKEGVRMGTLIVPNISRGRNREIFSGELTPAGWSGSSPPQPSRPTIDQSRRWPAIFIFQYEYLMFDSGVIRWVTGERH